MSCQGNFLSNSVCAAKSGISATASKSASVAKSVGGFYKDQANRRVETAKGVGVKVAGAAQSVGGAYKDRTKKNASAVAGAARSLGGFYKNRTIKNFRAAAAVPSGIKGFAGDARRAAQAHNAATREPKGALMEAINTYNKGVVKTKLGVRGKIAVAAVGAGGYMVGAAGNGSKAEGAMTGAGFASGVYTRLKENAYTKTPQGKSAAEAVKGAAAKYDAARKEANTRYAKSVLGAARQLAGKVKAARAN